MDVTAPCIKLPRVAELIGVPAHALRRLLAYHPDMPLVRWRGIHPRFSAVDVLRLAFMARLMDSGLDEGDALLVLGATLDPLLFGHATCGLPVPAAVVQGELARHAWHVTPGTPPTISHARNGPPDNAAVCLTINAGRIAADLFDALSTPAANGAASMELA